MSIRNELLEQILAAIGAPLNQDQIDAINSILNLTDNTMPVAIGGELVDSSITETLTDIVMTKTLIVPQNSLFIGPAVKLSDEGGFLGIENLADGLNSISALSRIFETETERDALFPDGIPKMSYQFLLPAKWVYQFPFESETSNVNMSSFELQDSDSTIIRMFRLYSTTALTGVRIFIENLLGSGDALVWENVSAKDFANGQGQTLNASGFTEIDVGFVKLATANIRLRFTIQAQPGDNIELTGETIDVGFGSYFYPKMHTYTQDIFELKLPDFQGLNDGNFGNFTTPVKFDTGSIEVRTAGALSDNIIQPIFTESITSDRPQISFVNGPTPIVIDEITVKHDGTWSPVQVNFNEERTTDVNLVNGDNTISVGPIALTVEAGQTVVITFTGAIGSGTQTQISLLGDVGQVPYYSLKTGDITATTPEANNISDTDATDLTDGGETTLHSHPSSTPIFGSEFEEFSSLAQSSTTSSSFQSKLSVTTALKPSGKYRVMFNAQATNKDGDKATEVEFEVDGVAQHNHSDGGDYITVISKEDNQWTSEFVVSYITLGSPSTIDLDINYRKDDKTARISDARIEIWRVI